MSKSVSVKGANTKVSSAGKGLTIGLALGGGGPMGGIYEIGALRALDEAFEGLDFNKLDHYLGVNAGAFVAANLANQITPAQMCRIFVRNESDIHPFHPGVFYAPAVREYVERVKAVPMLFGSALLGLLKNPSDQSFLEYLTVLTQAVPAGVFDNEGFHEYIARAFSSLGRTNDFKRLSRNLRIIATDLESGESVRFGDAENADIPISKAVQASMALPGMYVPVEYDNRFYVDGTLNKGMYTSLVFESGCDLVIAVNPVVPVGVRSREGSVSQLREKVIRSGMGNVIAQSYRTMVHSRLYSGLKNVKSDFPDKTLFLFEPSKAQAKMFLSSVFSFEVRKQICEQAYQTTRRQLLEQADLLEVKLKPAGVKLRRDILEDASRTLSSGLYGENMPMFESKVTPISHAVKKEVANTWEWVGQRVTSWF